MKGTMMRSPLTLTPLLERAGSFFASVEVVSRRPDGSLQRATYADFYRRARALAAALQAAGLQPGDRVATLMWNHAAHLECYFGIPAVGGVLHTLNLRLHPDELAFIVNHAGDRFLLVDDVLLPVFEKIRDRVKFERVVVVPFSGGPLAAGYQDYEAFLAQSSGPPEYPDLEEDDAAAMCYTSGTTGQPKGVVYSHRSLALHSLSVSLPDNFAMSRQDCVLPAMSMFHANAWGVPYAAVMHGCKLVFPGPNLQPEPLLDLLEQEHVTLTGAVPTVWMGVLDALKRAPQRWKLDPRLRIISAGSAVPESLFRGFDAFGVTLIQPWGMTETAPIATTSTLKPHMQGWSEDRKYEVRAKQGLPSPFIEIRVIGDGGGVPWDGESPGELQVRGPWVTASYFQLPEERDKWTEDGWLRTGDVCTIDAEGYIKITDRTKDLIKSGGEWISSVDLENALVGHDAVKEAAVVAVPHPKWVERPLAVVVLHDGARVAPEELRTFLARKFAKWQLPDDFVFVEELPHTSTGKLQKLRLRERFRNWGWGPDRGL
jgi:fatty-acyl-CoA synthase